MSRTLALVGVTPLTNIGGHLYGLWHYRLSWTAPNEPAFHVVQAGESLSSIAQNVLGDGRRWPEMFRLNRAIISNPNLIFPGQQLQLPSGVGLESQVGLGFSALIDIRSPQDFPGIPELGAIHVQKLANADLQFVSTALNQAHGNALDFFFVAPSDVNSSTAVILVTKGDLATGWNDLAFQTTIGVPAVGVQGLLKGPAVINSLPAGGNENGTTAPSTAVSFVGTLPYASEVFGVYQPLAGWLGRLTSQRLARFAPNAGTGTLVQKALLASPAALVSSPLLESTAASFPIRSTNFTSSARGILSPVGLVTLFREYFFEFDNFLGTPSGHLWISPGGTVEVIETSTRRTLVEKTAEQSEDSTSKVEESLTSHDDVADAVKEDNANDTKLGASVSAGGQFAGMYHADASASFSTQTTTHQSSEVTHKHTREQSAKVSSEIHRNFKTTFKTVTETTDVSSRRYVVQNTTDKLVNYELRRKMRKVGVQVQHIGTRLSWQVFLDVPGKDLGMGELVQIVPAPDVSSLKKPAELAPQEQKVADFAGVFPITKVPGTKVDPNINQNFILHARNSTEILDAGNEMHIVADVFLNAPPPAPGYTLRVVSLASAKSQGTDTTFVPQLPIEVTDKDKGVFHLFADRLNSGNLSPIQLTFNLNWDPPAVDPAKAQHDADLAVYNAEVADLQRRAYGAALKERVKLVSGIRRRPPEDLRKEERHTVYGKLIRDLQLFEEPHIGSELIRQIFDVDEMLYFAAPEYWRPSTTPVPPRTARSVGKYPVPPIPATSPVGPPPADPLDGETVAGWYSHTDQNNALDPLGAASAEFRIDYLITEDSQPAPLGSSLGWLIQIDGDERRNEFLNAAWVKAVLPVREGHELEALEWLAQANVEGESGLGQPYPFQPGDPESYRGKTLSEVLQVLASDLQAANTDINNTLATEKVFETGFDPLESGFRPAEPYMIFDQWIEVLPTDQIVALEVHYDAKTGKQL